MFPLTSNRSYSLSITENIHADVSFNNVSNKVAQQESKEREWLIHKLFSDENVIQAMALTDTIIHLNQMETHKVTRVHLEEIKHNFSALASLAGEVNAYQFSVITDPHGFIQFTMGDLVLSRVDKTNTMTNTHHDNADENDDDGSRGSAGSAGSGQNNGNPSAIPPLSHRYIISDAHFSRARHPDIVASSPKSHQAKSPKTMRQALLIR